MANKELDEQLQAFFEHNPLDDDMLYLKSYVKEHPDNKMGWYLLGKEYAARNKPGKAKYCFAQAGEVYEAFEKQKVKLDFMEGVKADQTMLAGQKGRRRSLYRSAKLAAALLAVILLGTYLDADSSGDDKKVSITTASPVESAESTDGTSPSVVERILYSNPLEQNREGELWEQFFLSGKLRNSRTLLLEGKLTSDGKWVNGLRMPALIASGRVPSSGGELQVAYHQAETCNCTPAQDPSAESEVRKWAELQEETVIVESAARSYLARYGGTLPESLDGLIRDYPDNLLPGYTEGMKRIYAAMTAAASTSVKSAVPGETESTTKSESKLSATRQKYLQEPLEIVVDKSAFRLALVSGNVILRSYPIGLGGSRTPEGVFNISDKVKHPNGSDNGDFGSRGMQLSDTNYAIHGTKEPRSIGENRSLGCVRMLKEDIEELFDMTPSGTKVTIGSGLLPADTLRKEITFRMPALREEKNPNKVYHWLD